MENLGIFVVFGVNLRSFFLLENSNYLFLEDYWTTSLCLVERFNILIYDIYQKFEKKTALKRKKLGIFSSLGHSGVLGTNYESPEISSNTNRTKQNSCELNSMGNTLKVEYKFCACQIL